MSPSIGSTMMGAVPMSSRSRRHDDYRDFFVGRYPQVVRTVWFVVHDWAVAEEVAQDAFLELYRHCRGCGITSVPSCGCARWRSAGPSARPRVERGERPLNEWPALQAPLRTRSGCRTLT